MVLAEGLVATYDVPPFDNSAMDGYAVTRRGHDWAPHLNIPATLLLTDTIRAGHAPNRRVSPRSSGQDHDWGPHARRERTRWCSLEVTEEAGDSVLVFEVAKPGKNVRPAAGDVSAGDPGP